MYNLIKKYVLTPSVCNPIIVYQMGKVGSQSVYVSLQKLKLNVPIHHRHFLNDFDRIETQVRQTQANPRKTLKELEMGRELRKLIDEGAYPKWNLISLTRDPVATNIAAFFENLTDVIPDAIERYSAGTISLDEITDAFITKYSRQDGPNVWFDRQVKDVFGIDVFTSAFPRDKGYAIHENSKARLLILRLEDLNQCVKSAMKDFLGFRNFTLETINIGNNKKYGEIYKVFKENFIPPDEYMVRMYEAKYARHFYSESEIQGFKNYWTQTYSKKR